MPVALLIGANGCIFQIQTDCYRESTDERLKFNAGAIDRNVTSLLLGPKQRSIIVNNLRSIYGYKVEVS